MERRIQFPLPYKEPNSALILGYYPLLNNIFTKGLRHLEEIHIQLKEWKPTPTALSKWVDTSDIHQNEESEAGRAIHALGFLGRHIAIFLSKIYTVVEEFVDLPPENEPHARGFLECINGIFLELEASVRDSPVVSLASVDVSCFVRMPNLCTELYRTRLIYALIEHNEKLFDTYLSAMVLRYTKPRERTWIYYTIGGMGVSVFLIWLLRQQYNETSYHEALTNFLINHINKPLISIREDLFKRSREAEAEAEIKDIKEAYDRYRSMLVEFTGQKSSKDNDMFREAQRRMKEHFEHPVRSVLNGGLIRGFIIRAQRLFLDYEIGKHWVSTFVGDNKLNLALLSALPAILLFHGLSRGYRAMVSSARELDRNMTRSLIAYVENAIIEYLKYGSEEDWGQLEEEARDNRVKHSHHLHGLVLHALHRFYRKIEIHAKLTKEWESLEAEIIYLGTARHNEQRLACLTRLQNFKCTSLA